MNRWSLTVWSVGICSLATSVLAQGFSPPQPRPRSVPAVASPAATLADSQRGDGLASLQVTMIERRLPQGSIDAAQRTAEKSTSAPSVSPMGLLAGNASVGQTLSAEEATRLLAAWRNDPEYCFVNESLLLLPLGQRGKFRSGGSVIPSAAAVSALAQQTSASDTPSPASLSEAEQAALAVPEFFGTEVEATITRLTPETLRVAFSVNHSEMVDAGPAKLPGKHVRSVRSQADLKVGQTLQLSGLKSRRQTSEATKVPWLSDLPLVGDALFTRTTTSDHECELILLITPSLVTDE